MHELLFASHRAEAIAFWGPVPFFADRRWGVIAQLAIVTSMVSRPLRREWQFVAHRNPATSRIANLRRCRRAGNRAWLATRFPGTEYCSERKPDASFQHELMRRYFLHRDRFRIPVRS